MDSCVHWSIMYYSQALQATQVPINRQVNKKEVAYVHNGILLGHKKNELLTFCKAWMDPKGLRLSERCQSVKDKYHAILLICGI